MGKKQRFNSFEDLGMAFGLKQTTPNKMENTKKVHQQILEKIIIILEIKVKIDRQHHIIL